MVLAQPPGGFFWAPHLPSAAPTECVQECPPLPCSGRAGAGRENRPPQQSLPALPSPQPLTATRLLSCCPYGFYILDVS